MVDHDDLVVSGAIDLSTSLREADELLLTSVDEIIGMAIAQGDPRVAAKFARGLRSNLQASGLALAKLLFSLSEAWKTFQSAGIEEDFVDWVYAEIGVSTNTTTKYVNMWRSIFANPEISRDIKDKLETKPMRSLLLLTAAAREDDLPWERVVEAETPAEVSSIVREIRGERTSSGSAVRLYVKKDGTLIAIQGDKRVSFGFLYVDARPENVLVDRAITRVLSGAGISEE
jgi:hypothetical protein